jgi:hypothetical protein
MYTRKRRHARNALARLLSRVQKQLQPERPRVTLSGEEAQTVRKAIHFVGSGLVAAAVGFLALPGTAQEANNKQGVPLSELSLCYEGCEYDKGRADEACARKRNKEAKALCFSKAMAVYSACRLGCEKRFKGGC